MKMEVMIVIRVYSAQCILDKSYNWGYVYHAVITQDTNTYDSLQTNTLCWIANPLEILNTISNYTKLVNYTIISEASNICKLFLTIHSNLQRVAQEIFYSLAQLDSHHKMEYVIVILSLQNTLIHAILTRLLSGVLLILGLLQLTK